MRPVPKRIELLARCSRGCKWEGRGKTVMLKKKGERDNQRPALTPEGGAVEKKDGRQSPESTPPHQEKRNSSFGGCLKEKLKGKDPRLVGQQKQNESVHKRLRNMVRL